MHSHDPERYLGDMLAYVHQSMTVEKSLLFALFPVDQDNAANLAALDKIFQGMKAALVTRAKSILGNLSSTITIFKLTSLLEYYLNAFTTSLEGPLVIDTIKELHKMYYDSFFMTIHTQLDRLLSSPPAYPRDLSVALEVSEIIRRLSDVLAVRSSAVDEQDDEVVVAPILKAFIEPLLELCRKSASGLDRSDASIYIINNILAIQSSLTRYRNTSFWVQKLTSEISDWTDYLVSQQAQSILGNSGISEKLELIERADPSTTLVMNPGLDAQSIKAVIDRFLKSLFSLSMPEFDSLSSPRLRTSARNATASAIANAYERLYIAMHDRGGYTSEQLEEILVHSPQQVRQLLDV